MRKVAIVADVTSSITSELAQKYEIAVVPFPVYYEERSFKGGLDLTPSEFDEFYHYIKQVQKAALPSSGPEVEGTRQAFREASSRAKSIFCIHLTSGMSKAVNISTSVADEFPQTAVKIMDTRLVAGSFGLIVLEAARAAASGKDLAEVASVAESIRDKASQFFLMESLEYMSRGGRIGKASAWAESPIDVKPITEVPASTGILAGVARPRTTSKALQELTEIMAQRVGDNAKVHVWINDGGMPTEAQQLKEMVSSRFNCAEIYLTPNTLIMAVHLGPVVGLGFYAD